MSTHTQHVPERNTPEIRCWSFPPERWFKSPEPPKMVPWIVLERGSVMELSIGDVFIAVVSIGGIALTCVYLAYGYVQSRRQ
jgi:hypothetical protein